MKALLRSTIALALLVLIASVVQQTVLSGSLTSGLVGGLTAFAWIGWVGVLACLPLVVIFIALLPRALDAFHGLPAPAVATGLAVGVTLVAVLALGVVSFLTRNPDQDAPSLWGVLPLLGVAALVGLVEGLARSRASRPEPQTT